MLRTGDCALYSRSCAYEKMAGIKVVSDDDIARWIFDDIDFEGEFTDESEHEETLPVCTDISSVNQDLVMEKKVTIIRNLYQVAGRFIVMGNVILLSSRTLLHNRNSPFLKLLGQKLNLYISSSLSQMI
jgi:hypothetical protein